MNHIVSYKPLYKADFKRINIEAISETFSLEAHDLEQLNWPETYILPNGGTILLAEFEGKIVGTVGLVCSAPGEYELVKLAVAKSWRAIGLGRQLCKAAIDYARRQQASRIWLEANTQLQSAIHLYETLGFVHVPSSASQYIRANVCMELRFNDTAQRMPSTTKPTWSVSSKFE